MGSLALTYFHMGRPHTIIGDAAFHFCVRDGNRWFHRSMDTRQRGLQTDSMLCLREVNAVTSTLILFVVSRQAVLALYGQASRVISTG